MPPSSPTSRLKVRSKPLIYVAGPYRSKHWWGIAANIYRAWKAACALWTHGYAVLCPHANSIWMSEWPVKVPADRFLGGDILMLAACDAILMLPGYSGGSSVGRHQEAIWQKHSTIRAPLGNGERGESAEWEQNKAGTATAKADLNAHPLGSGTLPDAPSAVHSPQSSSSSDTDAAHSLRSFEMPTQPGELFGNDFYVPPPFMPDFADHQA